MHKLKLVLSGAGRGKGIVEDTAFTTSKQRFLEHKTAALQLHSELLKFTDTWHGLGEACQSVGPVVSKFYSKTNSGNQDAVRAFADAEAQMAKVVLDDVEASLNGNCVREWTEYCGLLRSIESLLVDHKERLVQYRYYHNKVEKLKPHADAQKAKDRLAKNEVKLQLAKEAYENLNNELTRVFTELCDDAANAFHPLVYEVVSVQCRMLEGLWSASNEMKPPVMQLPKYRRLTQLYGVVDLKKSSGTRVKYAVKPNPALAAPGPSRGAANGSANKAAPPAPSPPPVPAPAPAPAAPAKAQAKSTPQAPPPPVPPPIPPSQPPPAKPPAKPPTQPAAKPPSLPAAKPPTLPPPALPSQPPPLEAKKTVEASELEDGGPELRVGARARALFAYTAQQADEVGLVEGDTVELLEQPEEGWWKVRTAAGVVGLVPYNYLAA